MSDYEQSEYQIAADSVRQKDKEEFDKNVSEMRATMHEFFGQSDKGKALLTFLKNSFINRVTLPATKEFMEQHGGPQCYLAYCAGQSSILFWIDNEIKLFKELESHVKESNKE